VVIVLRRNAAWSKYNRNRAAHSYRFAVFWFSGRPEPLSVELTLLIIEENTTQMTDTGYRALLAQREALEKQIEELRNAERGDAIEWIRQQMALFDVKPEDLEPRSSRGPRKQSAPVAAKYRDPASGATWSGRGKPPRWIADQDRDKFAITD
jgi:DNA-binding protein H-NS